MPITEQATYSEPKITRDETSAVIEYDITEGGVSSYEAIRLNVEGGELLVTNRPLGAAVTSILELPAPILPAFFAEAQRLAAVIS